MTRGRIFAFILVVGVIICGICNNVKAEGDWAITGYWARLTDGDLDDSASFRVGFEDSSLLAIALSRRFYSFRDILDFEVEGQIVKHFQDQNHWEFNGLGISRWLLFPWDNYIDTSIAAGIGLSYATETPVIEDKNHSETSQLLTYLLFEVAFSLPKVPQWSVVGRIHHRSGAFGLFNGVRGASNALGVGIRYSF